jgi:hypothetical protein
MCLVIEIIMLVGGLLTLITAKVPSLPMGGGKYKVEGPLARVIGSVLMVPLPAAFLSEIVLGVLFGEQGLEYAFWFEIALVLGAGSLAMILMMSVVGLPMVHASDAEAFIAKIAHDALICALLTATGVGGIIGCPLAFFYAGRGLRLIDEHGVSEEYRGRAAAARTIAGVITGLWVIAGVIALPPILVALLEILMREGFFY